MSGPSGVDHAIRKSPGLGYLGTVAFSKSARVEPNSGVWKIRSRRGSCSSTETRSGSVRVKTPLFTMVSF